MVVVLYLTYVRYIYGNDKVVYELVQLFMYSWMRLFVDAFFYYLASHFCIASFILLKFFQAQFSSFIFHLHYFTQLEILTKLGSIPMSLLNIKLLTEYYFLYAFKNLLNIR